MIINMCSILSHPKGLRCLLIAFKDLNANEFEHWQRDYKTACSDLTQIELLKKGEVSGRGPARPGRLPGCV
jgi:hypothetical protein